MDDAVSPGDERRARRFRIVVRLVFYPMALGLIALAWQQFHGDASSQGHVYRIGHWSGVTSQGQAIRVSSADESLAFLDTHVVERCSDGSEFTTHWYPARHRFVQHGDDFRGRQAGPGRDYSGKPVVYDSRVWGRMGAHPRGTIRAQVSWTTSRGRVSCDSGLVTFALGRSP